MDSEYHWSTIIQAPEINTDSPRGAGPKFNTACLAALKPDAEWLLIEHIHLAYFIIAFIWTE